LSGTSITRLALAGSLLFSALWASSAWAQTAEEFVASGHIRIRHRLEPAESVYVGQPVRLWVEVMTRTWFLEAPRYPATIEVPKAIVIPPESFGVNSTERIGGEIYAVQGRFFTVFPQTTGEFVMPPVQVILVVARDDASRSPEIVLRTEPITIEARLPTGVEGHGLVLSTPRLTMSEQYSRSTEGLRVGDSFERRVSTTIDNSAGMLLPPTEFAPSDGIAVYPARPEVTDTRNRGTMSGTRVDGATYVMEAEGSYVLPAITLHWWNLGTSRLEEEVLPQVDLTVEANPDLAAEHLGESYSEEAVTVESQDIEEEAPLDWQVIVAAGVSLFLLVVLLRRLQYKLSSEERSPSPEAVETGLFREFEKVARTGAPQSTFAAFVSWLDHLSAAGRLVPAWQFLERAQDEELTRQYDALVQGLYGGATPEMGPEWSGSEFSKAVRRGRRSFLAGDANRRGPQDPLPPLNPVAE
jgi:hypothetical protein